MSAAEIDNIPPLDIKAPPHPLSLGPKPRMLFLRWKTEGHAAWVQEFLDRMFLPGLHEFFDVTIVCQNGDYAEFCETHRPDIVLFESGIIGSQKTRLDLTNTSAHPEIPKIGFLHTDPMCITRSVFLSDMDRWGVETFFTNTTGMGEYMPEITDRIFYWPTATDPSVFYDYRLPKVMPVLMMGHVVAEYEWRAAVFKNLQGHVPLFLGVHPGTGANMGNVKEGAMKGLSGREFARVINAAQIAPTCGGMAHIIVNKQFEIPACRTLMVTEKTPGLVEAGYVDMENCVFATPNDVAEKTKAILADPALMQRITDSGYRLVHTRHTYHQRPQMRQWYEIVKSRPSGAVICQDGLFGDVYAAAAQENPMGRHLISHGSDRVLLDSGDALMQRGAYEEAAKYYAKCLQYTSYMPEPFVRLALSFLYRGNIGMARQCLEDLASRHRNVHLTDAEPEELSWLVILLLCEGKRQEAAQAAGRYPEMHRLNLNRARWAAAKANGQSSPVEPDMLLRNRAGFRASVHAYMGTWDFAHWTKEVALMLKNCGQIELGQLLIQEAIEICRKMQDAA